MHVVAANPQLYQPIITHLSALHGRNSWHVSDLGAWLEQTTLLKTPESTQLALVGLTVQDITLLSQRQQRLLDQQLAKLPSTTSLLVPRLDLDGALLDPYLALQSSLPWSWSGLPEQPELAERYPDLPITKQHYAMSALSQYALCPYRYFARYQLQLDTPEIDSYWGLPRRKLGELAHKLFENKLPVAFKNNPLREADLESLIPDYFPTGLNGVFQQLEWKNNKRTLIQALRDEASFMHDNQLQPEAFEKKLTLKIAVPLGQQQHEVLIHCRIDRIDTLTDDAGSPHLFIVDYKTNAGSVGPQERQQMRQLIQPQLPIYILALQQEQQVEVIGGMEVRLKSGKRGGLVVDDYAKQFKSRVFEKVASADFQMGFQQSLQALLQRLLTGDFKPAPQDPQRCGLGRCPYWGICRYDAVVSDSELEAAI